MTHLSPYGTGMENIQLVKYLGSLSVLRTPILIQSVHFSLQDKHESSLPFIGTGEAESLEYKYFSIVYLFQFEKASKGKKERGL